MLALTDTLIAATQGASLAQVIAAGAAVAWIPAAVWLRGLFK